mmetsp:Transcript_4552/g.8304  ORF Transcript_4552/g.8304 Transcript_4552/m.8304 type:complete len:265 (-) Transcript_4552:41-835(-)
MQFVHVSFVHLLVAGFTDYENVYGSTTVCITVGRMVDGSLSKFYSLLFVQIHAIRRIQDTICVSCSGTNREQVAFQPRAIAIDVEESGTLLFVPTRHHSSHAQAISSVLEHYISQELRCRCHRNSLALPQVMQPALHGEVALPERAVSSTTSHGSNEMATNRDHFLYCSRANIRSHTGTRVYCDQHAAVEDEGQRGGSVGELNLVIDSGHVSLASLISQLRKRAVFGQVRRLVKRKSRGDRRGDILEDLGILLLQLLARVGLEV